MSIPTVTHSTFSTHAYISWPTRITSAIRGLSVLLVKECPLFWSWLLQGSRNARADLEGEQAVSFIDPHTTHLGAGPYYILGAPDRQLEDGKVILATAEDLKGELSLYDAGRKADDPQLSHRIS